MTLLTASNVGQVERCVPSPMAAILFATNICPLKATTATIGAVKREADR